MKIHLISTGGAIMHNLAIALHKKGHVVTGSDDEIYNPARERLAKHGLLPTEMGWDEKRISNDLDLCILGMHARPNNPELLTAQKIGLPIYSFPEYVYRESIEKNRIVIAGSHGKTTTTSIILHVLKQCKHPVDFLVGAQLEGFDEMVNLSDADDLVVEGDEYLSSPIDRRPKFIHYKGHIAVITGIAWDHMNVFQTFEEYKNLFADLLESLQPNATVIFFDGDDHIHQLLSIRDDLQLIPYKNHLYSIIEGKWNLLDVKGNTYPIELFGEHNIQNIQAGWLVCKELGITEQQFLNSVRSFKGAAKRMQVIRQVNNSILFQDFAHAPSKVKASVKAVRQAYPNHRIIVCAELHTFSSLSKDFLPQYEGTLEGADLGIVFYQEHTLKMKNLPILETKFVEQCFQFKNLQVIQKKQQLASYLKENRTNEPTIFLMMSSGTFGGTNLVELASNLLFK